jgi:hypothetical protein
VGDPADIGHEVSVHTAKLNLGRQVVSAAAESLCELVQGHSNNHTRPIITPIDINIFMTTIATRRIKLGETNISDSEILGVAFEQASGQEDTPTTKDDKVTVNETVLDLDGSDMEAILKALKDSEPNEAQDVDVGLWESSLKDDVAKLCREKGDLFR